MATPTLVGVARIRNCWCKMEPTSASPSDNFSYHVLQALTVNPTKTILVSGITGTLCEIFTLNPGHEFFVLHVVAIGCWC